MEGTPLGNRQVTVVVAVAAGGELEAGLAGTEEIAAAEE